MKENVKAIFALVAWLNFLAYCWYLVIFNEQFFAGAIMFLLVAVIASAVAADSKK